MDRSGGIKMFKKKTPITETQEYKDQKKILDTPATIEHADIGGDGRSNDQPGILLEEVVIGMTDIEYRTHVLSLLMELKDDITELKRQLRDDS
jgi:hypothetical protein